MIAALKGNINPFDGPACNKHSSGREQAFAACLFFVSPIFIFRLLV